MQAMNVIALVKDSERYVFLYDDEPESQDALMDATLRHAADSELSFTENIAAMVTGRACAKQLLKQSEGS